MSPISPSLSRRAALVLLAAATVVGSAAAQTAEDVRAALDAGDAEGAASLAEKLVARKPQNAEAHLLLGRALDWLGDSESDEALDKAVELAPADPAILEGVVSTLAARFDDFLNGNDGKLAHLAPMTQERAEELCRRWAAAAPGDPMPAYWTAWMRKRAGERGAAIAMLFAAIARDPMVDPPHAELWSFLGTDLSYDGLAAFYEALALSDLGPEARSRCANYQGQVFAAKAAAAEGGAPSVGALEDARRAYLDAILCMETAARLDEEFARLAPYYVVSYKVRIAGIFGRLGDLAAARRAGQAATETLDPLLRADPDNAQLFEEVKRLADALCQAARGNDHDESSRAAGIGLLRETWEHAREIVRSADRDDAKLAVEQNVRTCEVYSTGDEDRAFEPACVAAQRAREVLEPALRAAPDDAYLRLAVDRLAYALYLSAGAAGGEGTEPARLVPARDVWQWAIGIVPDDAAWWNNLAFLCRETQAYEESYAAYRRCIELAPENARYVNDTGLILLYHLDRDLDEAQRLFERAIELGEAQYAALREDPALEPELRSALGDAYLNLGLLHRERGRFDEARAAYDRLAELDGGRVDLLSHRLELYMLSGDVERAKALVLGALQDDAPRDDRQDFGQAERVVLLRELIEEIAAARPDGDELKGLLLELLESSNRGKNADTAGGGR